jgi:hypothetical protein
MSIAAQPRSAGMVVRDPIIGAAETSRENRPAVVPSAGTNVAVALQGIRRYTGDISGGGRIGHALSSLPPTPRTSARRTAVIAA